MIVAIVLGALGLLLTGLGAIFDVRAALFSYLVAFAYWAGIGMAALLWLGAFHAARAKWIVVLRRPLEIMAATGIVLAVLFVPIAVGAEHLYAWVEPSPHLPEEALRLYQHKRPWLNVPFFVLRAAVYFAAWIVLATLIGRWSARQDVTPDPWLTQRQRRVGVAALPVMGLVLTFASLDWLMSLEPLWQSTIFGIYFFAGSFLAAMAALTLVALYDPARLFAGRLGLRHQHNLGKFLLAFVVFWAYIAFSQAMLIWIANLPEEIPWYRLRGGGAWAPVGLFLIVGHFAAPFFLLLSRDLKLRRAPMLAMAAWLLLVHYVDLYWVVMPVVSPHSVAPRWTDATALVGVGGVVVAFALWRARGMSTVPVGDPDLAASVRYGHEL